MVVLSFQSALNSTYGQKLLQTATNETSDVIQSLSRTTNETNGVDILTNRSFIDSSGNMHVVGDVGNDRSSIAVFVTIIGTFYDINDKVLGTQFTYTNPTDIESGKKAPFELIVTPRNFPISLIDHYNLQINYE